MSEQLVRRGQNGEAYAEPVIETHVQNMTPQAMVLAALASTQEELQLQLQSLNPRQQRWLRFRAMTDSDAQARHLMGKPRKEDSPHPMRPCQCGEHKPGWLDFREDTVLKWKRQPGFMMAYNTLLQSPVVFAATHLEMLAPAAVQTLAELMGGEHGAGPGDRRLSAQKILEATNLAQTPGSSGKPQAGTRQTLMDRVRAERERREISVSSRAVARGSEPKGEGLDEGQRERMESERGSDPSSYLIEA